MRKAAIAEWLVSLVVAPDRASSAIGDWTEEAAARGNLWFWSCVLRTVFAHIWRGIADTPFRMVSLGLRGCIFGMVLIVASFIPILLLSLPVAFLTRVIFSSPQHVEDVNRIMGDLIGWATLILCVFRTGQWIARRAPGREVAACVALCLTNQIAFYLIAFVIMRFWGTEITHFLMTHRDNTSGVPSTLPVASTVVTLISLFTGALKVRSKTLRQPARS